LEGKEDALLSRTHQTEMQRDSEKSKKRFVQANAGNYQQGKKNA
jgi:hypothetical protein